MPITTCLARWFALDEFDVKTTGQRGYKVRNGKLLKAAEDKGFDVLLTADLTMRYQQNMLRRQIGVSMSDNH